MSATAEKQSGIDGRAVAARVAALAAYSDDPVCLTRLTLSPSHKKAAAQIEVWMREAGMTTRMDGAGNIIGRYDGDRQNAKSLLLGSHIDTVRNAGHFDGNLGVIAAIAVVDELNRLGKRLPFAIDVIAFSDEEGVRFPSALSGSRAVAGIFDPACLDDKDAAGVSRRQALLEFGADPARIGQSAFDPATTLAYLEMHIEQGPVLEARNLPLGIVTAINGATRGEIIVGGEAGHSGTLPMHMRRDAMTAAAEMILAIESCALADENVVATVGRIEVPNGAVNIVPGQVRFSLDVRSASDEARFAALAKIEKDMAAIAERRRVSASFTSAYDMPATPCDPRIMDAMSQSFARNGHDPFRLASGAGHDAMTFRNRLPVGMIFVRCKGGISHNPAEFASAQDIGAATRILFDLLQDAGAFTWP